MSDAVTYPGVYIQETPTSPSIIVGVSTALTAFVGRTYRGPVNTPTLITSFADFQRLFGGLRADLPLSYSVRDFFQNGGTEALVVRLYRALSARNTATLTLSAPGDSGGLVLDAAAPGDWPNGALTATVDTDGIDTAASGALFNLSVTYTHPDGAAASERFTRVSLQADAGAARLDQALLAGSALVRYTLPSGASPATPPGGATGTAAGGAASEPLQDSDYLGDEPDRTGMYALDDVDLFNLLVIPPDQRLSASPRFPSADVYQAAAVYCLRRHAFLIADPPFYASPTWEQLWRQGQVADIGIPGSMGSYGPEGCNAAVYFPNLVELYPLTGSQPETFSPTGAVAGIYARTDSTAGVWKAPAGLTLGALSGVQGVELALTDTDDGTLNAQGINCLRTFPNYGSVVWGARTLKGADVLADDFQYVPVRRLASYIQQSVARGITWAAFQPNDAQLWSLLAQSVGTFMEQLYGQGAFAGTTPGTSYFVTCDASTTTPADVDAGVVNIQVGFAPVKPAEFVVLTFQQPAGPV